MRYFKSTISRGKLACDLIINRKIWYLKVFEILKYSIHTIEGGGGWGVQEILP